MPSMSLWNRLRHFGIGQICLAFRFCLRLRKLSILGLFGINPRREAAGVLEPHTTLPTISMGMGIWI